MKQMKSIDFGNDNIFEIVDNSARSDIEIIKNSITTLTGNIATLTGNISSINESISSNRNEIDILKERKTSKVLWTGGLYNGVIEFFIPRECYFSKTSNPALTLVLLYSKNDIGGVNSHGDNTAIVSFHQMASQDADGSYVAYFNTVEETHYYDNTGKTTINLYKLNTTEYSRCKITLNSDGFQFLSCVYAIVSNEL